MVSNDKSNMENENGRNKRARIQLIEPCFENEDEECIEEEFDTEDEDDHRDAISSHSQPLPPALQLLADQRWYRHWAPTAPPPPAFLCPLTLQVMYYPVLDKQGNSFERSAIRKWLRRDDQQRHQQESSTISPISCNPLHEDDLTPNTALREIIHLHMGKEWVDRKAREFEIEEEEHPRLTSASPASRSTNPTAFYNGLTSDESGRTSSAMAAASTATAHNRPWLSQPATPSSTTTPSTTEVSSRCPSRSKIDSYLEALGSSREFFGGGLRLRLNDQGSAAFRYNNVIVVIDVPATNEDPAGAAPGVFHLYTRGLLFDPDSAMKDRMLELNFLQGDTRGGCLSIKKHDRTSAGVAANSAGVIASTANQEVVFSYNDCVDSITSSAFGNILLNFVQTAFAIRGELLVVAAAGCCGCAYDVIGE